VGSGRGTPTVVGGVLAAVFLAGCGAGGTGAADHQPLRPADLYVVHRGTSDEPPRLSAYRIDPGTGALIAAPVTGSALPLEDRVHELVVDPGNRFVYVATRHASAVNGGSSLRGLVYGYARDAATGGLTPLPGSPFGDTQGGDFRSPVLGAAGRFLYVCDPLSETIDAFAVDTASGALRPLPGRSVFPAANNVDGVATDPSGHSLYATSSDGSVLSYAVDAGGGLAGPQGALPTGRSTAIPVVHPNGRFLYAPNAGSNDVSGYAIDPASGLLSTLPGSPFASGLGPVALAFAPGGASLYVVNGQESTVAAFAVDAASGALRRLGGVVPTGGPTEAAGSIVAEPGGRFVYVAGFTSWTLATYAVDPVTGALSVASSPVPTLPRPAALAVTHRSE